MKEAIETRESEKSRDGRVLEPAGDEWRVERVLERVSVDVAAHEAVGFDVFNSSQRSAHMTITGKRRRRTALTQRSRGWRARCWRS